MDNKRAYCNIDGYENLPMIRISDIETFESLIKEHNPDSIFVAQIKTAGERDLINFGKSKSTAKTVTEFSFLHDNLIYVVDTQGYQTLEDYHEGIQKGFESGSDYTSARDGKFIDRDEYEACKKAGFADRITFLKAETVNYLESLDKLTAAHAEGRLTDEAYKKVKTFKNDAQVYEFGQEAGYESYQELENAFASGFTKADADDYRKARDLGFDDSDSYFGAQKGSFEDSKEYAQAQSLGISDKAEFEQYNEMEGIRSQYGFRTTEQAHLFTLLAELPAGRKMSVAKIWDTLKEAQEGMKITSNAGKNWFDRPIMSFFGANTSPNWYTTAFRDLVELKVFLISNENVAQVGTYDADGEVFERAGEEQTATVAAEEGNSTAEEESAE